MGNLGRPAKVSKAFLWAFRMYCQQRKGFLPLKQNVELCFFFNVQRVAGNRQVPGVLTAKNIWEQLSVVEAGN